jgi:hypothetical protein
MLSWAVTFLVVALCWDTRSLAVLLGQPVISPGFSLSSFNRLCTQFAGGATRTYSVKLGWLLIREQSSTRQFSSLYFKMAD